jgi:hypothetical protein
MCGKRLADDTLLEDLNFSVAVYNYLKRAGINLKSDIEKLSEDDILKIRGISKARLNEIKKGVNMDKKHNVNDINLEVYKIEPIKNGLCICWNSSIGFGEYNIWIEEGGKICGDSECMDNQDDKNFIRKLFELIANQMIVY